ncbi:MAG: SBBP repeat-containing protein [Phycisphaerae bacterium]
MHSLRFEVNHGQAPEGRAFVARGPGYQLLLSATDAVLALRQPHLSSDSAGRAGGSVAGKGVAEDPARLVIRMAGGSAAARVVGLEELTGKVNYLLGDDPAQWRRGVPTYGRVRCEQVWPGVDVEYYGTQGELEFDFVVSPGADPSQISFDIHGACGLRVSPQGELIADVPGGQITLRRPLTWQQRDDERVEIACSYELCGERSVRVRLGAYEPALALVVDPVVEFSTYLGGSTPDPLTTQDQAFAVAMDNLGNAYVAGRTGQSNFPTVSGSLGTTSNGSGDAFVAKFDPIGNLLYSTYIGGSDADRANDIAVDSVGNAYITGQTFSTNFPTLGAFQPTRRAGFDAFVMKLSPSGDAVVYSTYLGGSSDDQGLGIAVDAAGHAYVTGSAGGGGFPFFHTTSGAFKSTPNDPGGVSDVFFAKLHPSGSSLIYSTLIGGGGYQDWGNDIAIDAAGRACIVGTTSVFAGSPGAFPATAGAFQGPGPLTSFGHEDGFLAIIDPGGNGAADLIYSTYLRGASGFGFERADAVGLDSDGDVYVVGYTASGNFPTTPGAFDTTYNGTGDVFAVKLSPGGNGSQDLVYGTYIGGPTGDGDTDTDAVVDDNGGVFLTAITSGDFPVTSDAIQPAIPGAGDAVLALLSPDGSSLVYSSYVGGSLDDRSHGVAAHASGSVVVVGETQSANFPSFNAFQPTRRGAGDAFVIRFTGFVINVPPTLLCPAPINAECTSPDGAQVTLNMNAADDDGDALTVVWTVDSADVQTDTVPAGQAPTTAAVTLTHLFSIGTHTLEVSISDGTDVSACPGILIVVSDAAAPVLVCPMQLEVSADASCLGAVPDVTALATANDDCTPAGSISITQAPSAGTAVALGLHAITVNAIDSSGNSVSTEVALVVLDQTPPTISDSPATASITANADCSAAAPDLIADVVASDNCSGTIELAQEPPAGTPLALGANVITITATDAAGNSGSIDVAVHVHDTIPPAITRNGADPLEIECHAGSFVDPGAIAVDACDPEVPVLIGGDTVDVGSIGTYFVTYDALDDSGNAAETVHRTVIVGPQTPVANAGPDQTVAEDTPVVLDGSATSSIFCGTPSYAWTQVAGEPALLDLSDPIRPTFVAPLVPIGGATLTFELVVTNGARVSEPDVVNIHIANVNHAPVAVAGEDQTVAEMTLVTLHGLGSFDPDDDPLNYAWVQLVGEPVVLDLTDPINPVFLAPLTGPVGTFLGFELTVDDGIDTHADFVTIVVENVNHLPTANAGEDQTLAEGALVELDGTLSSDPDDDPLTYNWSQLSGPAVTLTDGDTPTPTFSAPDIAAGGAALVFQLQVEDGFGGSATDDVTIIVENADSPPACAHAKPSHDYLWPPNHKMVRVKIEGVRDSLNDHEGDDDDDDEHPRRRKYHSRSHGHCGRGEVTITILSVTQDEPVNGLGDGDTGPDAVIQGESVLLRAERSGGGNGRVYRITFLAEDEHGGACVGEVTVCVPHDNRKGACRRGHGNSPDPQCADDGQIYNALGD